MLRTLLAALLSVGLAGPLAAGETTMPGDAKVYIIWPSDGQVIKGGKLWLRMGIRNAGLAPAGTEWPGTGHHHVIIDSELPPFDDEIPSDKNHLHFGGGQSEARLELPPGTHTIQILLGDHFHVPHDPPLYSERITVVVPAD